MKNYTPITILIVGIAIGVAAGHYHGKAQTLEGFIGTNITCKLGVNPVTHDMLR